MGWWHLPIPLLSIPTWTSRTGNPLGLLRAAHACNQTQPELALNQHNLLLGLSKATSPIHAKEQLSTHSLASAFSHWLVLSPAGQTPGGRALQTEGEGQLVENYRTMGTLMPEGGGAAAVREVY